MAVVTNSVRNNNAFSDWWDDLERPCRLLDQYFGTALSPDELLRVLPMPPLAPPFASHLSPWRDLLLLEQNATPTAAAPGSVVGDNKQDNKFQVHDDTTQLSSITHSSSIAHSVTY